MVFKGNIEYLTENEIGIRLRATQQNPSVLPAESLYAIEHDTMDTTFRSMYQGLYAYLSARKERRDLLLSQRPPRFDESLDSMIFCSEDDFTRVALKAKGRTGLFPSYRTSGNRQDFMCLEENGRDFPCRQGCADSFAFPIPTGRLMRYASRWLPLLRQLTLSGRK